MKNNSVNGILAESENRSLVGNSFSILRMFRSNEFFNPISGRNESLIKGTTNCRKRPFTLRPGVCAALLLAAMGYSVHTAHASMGGENTYFADSDGDGFGNNDVFLTMAGDAPVGYVPTGGDCNDENSAIFPGATELYNGVDDDCDGWVDENVSGTIFYLDLDGDGFGNPQISISASSQPLGYAVTGTDCNDGDPAINPAAPELCNGYDDNCNGTIDEGCGPQNDERSGANNLIIRVLGDQTPQFGTLVGATTSSQPGAPVFSGEDVWYRFQAEVEGLRIFCQSYEANVMLELQDALGNIIDVENQNPANGAEVMNLSGLVPGYTYFLRVRNYDSLQGSGNFGLCANKLAPSQLSGGPELYSLCDAAEALSTGADQYIFRFVPISGEGVLTGNTQPGSTALSLNSLREIAYGSSYRVRVDALYALSNGAGQSEMIFIEGRQEIVMRTAYHFDLDLDEQFQYDLTGNTVAKSAVISTQNWICNATYYEWSFRRVGSFYSFSAFGAEGSRVLPLSDLAQLAEGELYEVRIRPWFADGGTPGDFGPDYQLIRISNPAVADSEGSDNHANEHIIGSEKKSPTLMLYPNPNSGEEINVLLTNIQTDQAQIEIYSAIGKKMGSSLHIPMGGRLLAQIRPEQKLPAGMYELVVKYEDKMLIQKIVVSGK